MRDNDKGTTPGVKNMSIATAVQKSLPGVLTHFKKHWWKWVLLILALGWAFSGFSCESETVVIKKSPIKPLKSEPAKQPEKQKLWEYLGD